jgi:hypothetical protein
MTLLNVCCCHEAVSMSVKSNCDDRFTVGVAVDSKYYECSVGIFVDGPNRLSDIELST